jgi:hypothetical protein
MARLFRLIIIVLLIFVGRVSFAQESSAKEGITIRRIDQPIKLDGILDEKAWALSDSAYNFYQNFPSDTSLAIAQTTAYILYDDNFIYVGAIMRSPDDRAYITPSLRRDFRGEANDSFSVLFDTFQDKTNGTLFGINPFGVRREGLITNGGSGREAFSLDWDNKWDGETKIYDDYWVAEMAIPFKTLRFGGNQSEWNINFYRIDSEYAERSTWAPIPLNFFIINMATMKTLKWDKPVTKTGSNISFIPYVSAGRSRDHEEGTAPENDLNAGFDVKYAVSAGLNLDLTVNPDFSQVEVDRQVTNLDRFEIFFPEKRQFFLENADLFASNGVSGTRPFFSRRIGIASDTTTGTVIQNPIPFGARLSGKLGQNTRIGFLNMQTASIESIQQPSTNYTVATIQQKVLDRSNIDFIFVNKQPFDLDYADSTYSFDANRTVGVDFNLLSSDNKWSGNLFFHHSFDKDQPDSAFAAGLYLNYSVQKWSWSLRSQNIGAGYNPEVGFVRRTDFVKFANTVTYSVFPTGSIVQSHGPGFDFDIITRKGEGLLDWDANILYQIRFRNTANFQMRLRRQYYNLTSPFDPSGSDGLELPEGSEYTNDFVIASYQSDAREKFFFQVRTNTGQYFNGNRISLGGSIGYRYQPFGATTIDFSYNDINLPAPYNSSKLFLVGPKFDFTFTDKLFWTTYVQYNSQIENLNINSRLQWRFKPVSDIYLVYTDNYFAYNPEGGFFNIGTVKSRALVFKISYWLNL